MHFDVCYKQVAAFPRIRVHALSKTIMLQRGKTNPQVLLSLPQCGFCGLPSVPTLVWTGAARQRQL